MSDLNSVNATGRIASEEIVLEHIESGGREVAVASFRLAVHGRKDDEVNYFACKVYGPAAAAAARHIGKGERVGINGQLKQERWEAKDGSPRSRVVIASYSVVFLGSPKRAESGVAETATAN